MNPNLAILGGTPTLSSPMHWSWPPRYLGMGELLRNYVDSDKPLSIQGSDGIYADCEQALARRFDRRHALMCSSGTMALYSAYFALGIKPGDEVICPTVTYHATATPALHVGAHVVLVDVEPDTGNISIAAAEEAITERTVAIASNAMWGHPVEQTALRQLCDRHHLAWIEDVSHAHFATFEGRPVGSYGDIACASLQGNKLISGGEGGVLLTNNCDYFMQAVLLGHNLKRSTELTRGTPCEPLGRTGYGLKLRCHPLAAVLIHDQLVNHADTWVKERHRSLTDLSNALSKLPGFEPPVVKPYVTSMGAWFGYKPRIDVERIGVSLQTLVDALQREGMDVDIPGSPPLHTLALFDPDRFQIGPYSKHDNRSKEYLGTAAYQQNRLSLPTPTGERDAELADQLVRGFSKVWDHLDELRAYDRQRG